MVLNIARNFLVVRVKKTHPPSNLVKNGFVLDFKNKKNPE